MLKRRADAGVRVFVVWQPMLPSDWAAPADSTLRRLSDRRVQQFWDPDHLVARQMERDARPPQPSPDCCTRSGILWDLAAFFPAGAEWTDRLPPATFFNGPVVDVAGEVEALLPAAAAGRLAPEGAVPATAGRAGRP